MAKALMIQGTASNAGKSLTVAGLCRVFRQDGFSVAPFKSQNMALNSFVTLDGLEMGRAQVVQAEAAGIEPSVLMNPILLKPTGDAASQVIVNGEVVGNMRATEYYARKSEFTPVVRRAYAELAARHDIVVIEGAGSPAEINLPADEFVNMGMAAIADAPVLLVGDIDRGGVFASLYGTVALLPPADRARLRGLVINKFRGDAAILRPGLAQLEELTGVPVLGVVPWMRVDIDDEDSVTGRLDAAAPARGGGAIDVAVLRLPRISNFTDFNALERHPAFAVRYVDSVRRLAVPDLIILPGSKNTVADLLWLRGSGLEAAVKKLAGCGTPVVGICGGFQMLGSAIEDPDNVERGGSVAGMNLLPARTRFGREKKRRRVAGVVRNLSGFFSCLSGAGFSGYEIHMGRSTPADGAGETEKEAEAFADLVPDGDDAENAAATDGMALGNVAGTYVHGLFDSGEIAGRLAERLLAGKGMRVAETECVEPAAYKEEQYNLLAGYIRAALDMRSVYSLLEI